MRLNSDAEHIKALADIASLLRSDDPNYKYRVHQLKNDREKYRLGWRYNYNMGIRSIGGLSILMILGIFFPTVSNAQPIEAEMPVVKVGAYKNSPKIHFDKNNKVSGFWPDLIEGIAAREQWKIEYVTGNWSDGIKRLKNGEIDMMPDVAYTEERSKLYTFCDTPVLLSWTRVYVHANSSSIKSIADLQGRKIAVLKDSVNVDGENGLRDIINQFNMAVKIVELNDYEEVFEAIQNQTVDAGITNRNWGNKNAGHYTVKKSPIIFQPIGMRFAFPKNSKQTPYLVARINAELLALQNDSESFYYQLLEKYFEAEIAVRKETVLPDWVKMAVQITTVRYNSCLAPSNPLQRKDKTPHFSVTDLNLPQFCIHALATTWREGFTHVHRTDYFFSDYGSPSHARVSMLCSSLPGQPQG